MNNPGKIRYKKKSNKFASTVMFVLIFLLSVSTIITIQLRSEKRNKQLSDQSAKTSTQPVPASTDNISEESVNITKSNDISDVQITPSEPSDIAADTQEAENIFSLPLKGNVIKSYSPTELVYSKTMDDWRQHMGCDIECEIGDTVQAMSDGVISNIYNDAQLGSTVVIKHNHSIITKYSNIALMDDIAVNNHVKRGQILGNAQANPNSEVNDSMHIHIEAAKDDVRIDPLSLIK